MATKPKGLLKAGFDTNTNKILSQDPQTLKFLHRAHGMHTDCKMFYPKLFKKKKLGGALPKALQANRIECQCIRPGYLAI